MVAHIMSTEELKALAAAQTPLQPRGAALAFIIVTVICYVLTFMAIGLRIYARAFREQTGRSIWGWDDTFAVLGMVCTEYLIRDSPHLQFAYAVSY